MKVFRIEGDRKRYQMIGGAEQFVEKYLPIPVASPRLEHWTPMVLSVDDDSKARGDFLFFPFEFLVTSSEVGSAFQPFIDNDVQLLPISLGGEQEEYCLWNTVNFVDALDLGRVQFKPSPFSSIPARWAFHAEAITRPMLFRVPQCPRDLLVTCEVGGGTGFYEQYQERGLTGLAFTEIWSG